MSLCASTCSSAFTSELVCTVEDSAGFERQGSDAFWTRNVKSFRSSLSRFSAF